MNLKITKGLPLFSEVNKDRRVVFVEFPNCISSTTNESFKWMPTYSQLDEINKALAEIEKESWDTNKLQEVKMDIQEYTKATGNFLRADDVMQDAKKIFVITEEATLVTSNKYQTERCHIPGEFSAQKKVFDCSKTNARIITETLGTDTMKWIGKGLELETYKTKTSDGKMVDAINIKAIKKL